MTDRSDVSAKPPVEHHEIQDSIQTFTFDGFKIAAVSTESTNSPRWTTMDLFKVVNSGSGVQYVLFIVGHSVLYHKMGSTCNAGVPTAVSALPTDAEPCFKCVHNSEVMETVELEEDFPTVHVCSNVQEVRDKLRWTRGENSGSGSLSRPAQRLLLIAAQNDAAFNPGQDVVRL